MYCLVHTVRRRQEMRTSAATVCLSGSLVEKLHAFAAAGGAEPCGRRMVNAMNSTSSPHAASPTTAAGQGKNPCDSE